MLARTMRGLSDSLTITRILKRGINPFQLDRWERRQFVRLRRCFTRASFVVYDIGAFTGRYSRFFAKLPWCTKVVAFEPIPSVFAELEQQIADYAKVEAVNAALGEEPGFVPMFVDSYAPASSLLKMTSRHVQAFPMTGRQEQQQVQVVRLDDYVREHRLPPPDFVKIDVQGFEDRVVRGGMETLRQASWCLIELSLLPLYEGGVRIEGMMALLDELGLGLVDIVKQTPSQQGYVVQVDGLFKRKTEQES